MLQHVHRAPVFRLASAFGWLFVMGWGGCAPGPTTVGTGHHEAQTVGRDAAWIDAALYCETSVDMFCSYYVRCNRMAVDSVAECRTTFLEACNARFEPFYADLARRGWLRLSADGLAACTRHLDAVDCEAQVGDLDGCGGLWVGTVPVGGACGAGLDRFVCAPDAVCDVDGPGCGRCAARADRSGSCGEGTVCGWGDACVEGRCRPRAPVGSACDATIAGHCISGTVCVDGVCVRDTVVRVGDACGPEHRCPYRSNCVAGTCERTALRGEPCSDVIRCASGFCAEGRCRAYRSIGESCGEHGDCVTRACENGRCAPFPWTCMESDATRD